MKNKDFLKCEFQIDGKHLVQISKLTNITIEQIDNWDGELEVYLQFVLTEEAVKMLGLLVAMDVLRTDLSKEFHSFPAILSQPKKISIVIDDGRVFINHCISISRIPAEFVRTGDTLELIFSSIGNI